jgi:hypothetical protein
MKHPALKRLADRIRSLLAEADPPEIPAVGVRPPASGHPERRRSLPTPEDSQYFHRRGYDGVGGEAG